MPKKVPWKKAESLLKVRNGKNANPGLKNGLVYHYVEEYLKLNGNLQIGVVRRPGVTRCALKLNR